MTTQFYVYYFQKLDFIREAQIGEFEAAIQPIIQEKPEEKKRKGKLPIIEEKHKEKKRKGKLPIIEEKHEEKKRIKRRRGGEDEGQYKKAKEVTIVN